MLGVRADKRWAARDAGLSVPRQNGKSVVAELLVIAGLYLFKEELIVYTAHQVDTALEIFERIVTRIESNPELKRRLPRNGVRRAQGSQSVTLIATKDSPKQRLLIKARSKGGVRGFSADRIFFDEAQLGLDENEIAALGPTQRTRPNPQTIFMGTPPLVAGTYWALKVRAQALAGDPKMSWHEWSPPKGFDEDDRGVWRSTNPALASGLITEEDVEYDRKRLGSKFSAEGLGFWLPEADEAGWLVFKYEDWTAAQDPDTKLVGRPAYCVELSRELDMVSIGAAGRREDGKRHLELVERFPADEAKLIGNLKKKQAQFDPVAIVVDPAGPANVFIPAIEKHLGIEVVKPIGRDVAAACTSVYVGIAGQNLEARDVRIRPHPTLDAAAKSADWRDRGDAKAFDRRNDDGPDVAPLMSIVLADHAHATTEQTELWGFYG
jgi:phage terminase large subunit-like protein